MVLMSSVRQVLAVRNLLSYEAGWYSPPTVDPLWKQTHHKVLTHKPTRGYNCGSLTSWSAINARWYYLLVCSGDDEHVLLPSLFSVSLDGDNRSKQIFLSSLLNYMNPQRITSYDV